MARIRINTTVKRETGLAFRNKADMQGIPYSKLLEEILQKEFPPNYSREVQQ